MNTQVMFYLLAEDNNEDKIYASLLQACFQAAFFYRQGKRVFIYANDQQQAHVVDELLWSFSADSFVPHNLVGEGQQQGAAVEISWQQPTNRRAVLINLTSTVPDFAHQFSHIVDFVATDETLKQRARERYKMYRQLGFQVDNQAVSSQ